MTLRSVRPSAILVVAFLAACGGDDGIGHTASFAPFEEIAGTYTGALNGSMDGVVLDAIFSLIITQNQGQVSGSWATTGTLNADTSVVAVQEAGSFTGGLAQGENPLVLITLANQCPDYSAQFSGSMDSADTLLSLSGPVDILGDDCTILMTFQSVILLRR